jgi:stearoyl-CoA desaturase (delta-9 desaturase)
MELKHPPKFNPGPEILDDRFYQVLQKTAMLQQIPIGLALYGFGGMSWLA